MSIYPFLGSQSGHKLNNRISVMWPILTNAER